VYRLRGSRVVSTVFFPPIVDDPYTYGRIAAANSLSDIYAMGARPVLALNVVAFPTKKLPLTVLAAILAGARSAIAPPVPWSAVALGMRRRLKYGLAVTGTAVPREIVRNGGARSGTCSYSRRPWDRDSGHRDQTRRGRCSRERSAVESMVALNDVAGAALVEFAQPADVTGFGLARHAAEVALASEGRLVFDASALALLPAPHGWRKRMLTGGSSHRGHRDASCPFHPMLLRC
jgi:selenide,water dikinase